MVTVNPLEWKDAYSVKVAVIDSQHKLLFTTLNELVQNLNTTPSKEKNDVIIEKILKYKQTHFETEERYFEQFKYEGAAEHIREHRRFAESLVALQNGYGDQPIDFAFKLVDFLEDWLIHHLMNYDQKYVQCFQEHGLH